MSGPSHTIRVVANAMDGLALRHEAAAANLANASTPGFKRLAVSFEEELERAAAGGSFAPKVEVDRSAGGPDGNNVVPEDEIGTLTRVELVYRTLARSITHHAQLMRLAMTSR